MPIRTRNSTKNIAKEKTNLLSTANSEKGDKTKNHKIGKHKQSQDQSQTQSSIGLKTKTQTLQKKVIKKAATTTVKKTVWQQKPLFKDLKRRIKDFSPQKVPSHFLDNLNYLLERQGRNQIFSHNKKVECRKLLKKAQQNKAIDKDVKKMQKVLGLKQKNTSTQINYDVQINWKLRYDGFACLIDWILEYLQEINMCSSSFSCCYFLYMMLNADMQLPELKSRQVNNVKIHKYIITAIFVSTKYLQIYPPYLQDIIQNINQYFQIKQIIKFETLIYQMNDFSEYFVDNQSVFLQYFSIILNWDEEHTKFCMYILQSGLNNPELYQELPSYKACAVISAYEKMKFKTNQKTQSIRLLIDIPIQKQKEIIKKYTKALDYNKKNRIYTQKKKYFVFQDFKEIL